MQLLNYYNKQYSKILFVAARKKQQQIKCNTNSEPKIFAVQLMRNVKLGIKLVPAVVSLIFSALKIGLKRRIENLKTASSLSRGRFRSWWCNREPELQRARHFWLNFGDLANYTSEEKEALMLAVLSPLSLFLFPPLL